MRSSLLMLRWDVLASAATQSQPCRHHNKVLSFPMPVCMPPGTMTQLSAIQHTQKNLTLHRILSFVCDNGHQEGGNNNQHKMFSNTSSLCFCIHLAVVFLHHCDHLLHCFVHLPCCCLCFFLHSVFKKNHQEGAGSVLKTKVNNK